MRVMVLETQTMGNNLVEFGQRHPDNEEVIGRCQHCRWIITCLTISSSKESSANTWPSQWIVTVILTFSTKGYPFAQISQISRSVVSDSLWPHESQHARPPCPSPTPGVHSDSGPLSQWCHPAISSSVIPLSSGPQSLPTSESFPMSQLFTWGGQSTGVSALASFLPKKIPGLISFRMDWLDLLAVQGTLKSLLQHQMYYCIL